MRLTIATIALTFVASCGWFEKDNPKPKPDNRVTQEQKDEMIALREQIRTWAHTCDGIACGIDGEGREQAGDSMLWAGLLCASGEESQCAAVKRSQKTSGELCRYPACDRTKNSFSRDMLVGYLASLTKTRDFINANRFVKYVTENNYKMCTDATDNRCDLTRPQHNAIWATMGKVWRKMGITPTKDMKEADSVGDETIIQLESIFATEGYPRHLVAAELWVRQLSNNWSTQLQSAADQTLAFQPKNPFFIYVAKGATKQAAQEVLEKCPAEKPEPDSNDWAWQRDESEQAWKQAKGWDCIFIINLLAR